MYKINNYKTFTETTTSDDTRGTSQCLNGQGCLGARKIDGYLFSNNGKPFEAVSQT